MPSNPFMTCRGALPQVLVLGLAFALTACGGGSSSTQAAAPASTVSAATVQSATANTAAVPQAATEANDTTVAVAQVIVAAGQDNVTIQCAGGGSATYQVTGPIAPVVGVLEPGDTYSLTFANCTGALGLESVNGALTLQVIQATSTDLSIATATNNVVVTLPRGTVTLNGNSTYQRTTSTSGSTTTTTGQWQTPSYTIATAFNGRDSSFAFTNIDLTRTVVTTNGVLTSTTCGGSGTFSATLPNGSFTVSESTQGNVQFDATGTPTAGSWTLTQPNDTITVTVANGTATAVVTGSGGTVEATYTYPVTTLMGEAG